MADKVYFRGSRATARLLALRLSLMLTGRAPDHLGIARGVFLTLGFAALDSIKQDFIVKSHGGTGIDGVKWPPLSKEYVAYQRRFGTGEKAALKRAAGLGKGHRFAPGGQKGLLTSQQLKAWQKIFGSRLARFSLSMPIGQAKAKAAAIAWAELKKQGAKTMLEVYGNRKVDILRDTGVLLNSLSPGRLDNPGPDANYSPPTSEGGEDQIFELQTSGVIVGTNVPYAAYHQDGKRPFLPKDQIPDAWEQDWLNQGTKALAIGARMMYEGAA